MIGHATVKALLVVGGVGLVAGACSESSTPLDPQVEPTALLSVVPQGGSTDVDRFAPVVVEFDHAMMAGMQEHAVLHEGDVTGPDVAGTWTLSTDRSTLTFTPAAPLAPSTLYTIHLGGGMTDANGDHIDFGTHGDHMGGAWATQGMMGGGMMGGGMMGGAMGEAHMGDGWQHPTNGSYGMVFSFTTGS